LFDAHVDPFRAFGILEREAPYHPAFRISTSAEGRFLEIGERVQRPVRRRYRTFGEGPAIQSGIFLACRLFLGTQAFVIEKEDKSVRSQVIKDRSGFVES
jgi:hypothetical protein